MKFWLSIGVGGGGTSLPCCFCVSIIRNCLNDVLMLDAEVPLDILQMHARTHTTLN